MTEMGEGWAKDRREKKRGMRDHGYVETMMMVRDGKSQSQRQAKRAIAILPKTIVAIAQGAVCEVFLIRGAVGVGVSWW